MNPEKFISPASSEEVTNQLKKVEPIWLEGEQTERIRQKPEDATMRLSEEDIFESPSEQLKRLQEIPDEELNLHVENVFDEIFDETKISQKQEDVTKNLGIAKEFNSIDQPKVAPQEEPITKNLNVRKNDIAFDETNLLSTKEKPIASDDQEKYNRFVESETIDAPIEKDSERNHTMDASSQEEPIQNNDNEFLDPDSIEYKNLIETAEKEQAERLPLMERKPNGNYVTPFDGEFEMTGVTIGKGGQGTVFEVKQINNQNENVLGVLKVQNISDNQIAKLMAQEARILNKLKDVPEVIDIYGVELNKDTYGTNSTELLLEYGGKPLDSLFEQEAAQKFGSIILNKFNTASPADKSKLIQRWSTESFDFESELSKIDSTQPEQFENLLLSHEKFDNGAYKRKPILKDINFLLQFLNPQEQEEFFKTRFEMSENHQKRYEAAYKAIDQMHNREQPIIHRDFKPENIVFNPETGESKVIDPGIAFEFPKKFARNNFNSRKEQLEAIQEAINNGNEQFGKLLQTINGTISYMYPTSFGFGGKNKLDRLDNLLPSREFDMKALALCQLNQEFESMGLPQFPAMAAKLFDGMPLPLYDAKYNDMVAMEMCGVMIFNEKGEEEPFLTDPIKRILFTGIENQSELKGEQREKVLPSSKDLYNALAQLSTRLKKASQYGATNIARISEGIHKASNMTEMFNKSKQLTEQQIKEFWDFPELQNENA